MTIPPRMLEEEYQNWWRLGICHLILKEAFHEQVYAVAQKLHEDIFNDTPPRGYKDFQKKLLTHYPKNVDNVTGERQEPNWKNATKDCKKLRSDPWAVAKIFMNPGQKQTNIGPASTDISGMLNFKIHCTKFPCHLSEESKQKVVNVRDKARNPTFHKADMRVNSNDFQQKVDIILEMLKDGNIIDQEDVCVKKAITEIEEVKTCDVKVVSEKHVGSELKVHSDMIGSLEQRQIALEEEWKDGRIDDSDWEKGQKEVAKELKKVEVFCNKNKDIQERLQSRVMKVTRRQETLEREFKDLKRRVERLEHRPPGRNTYVLMQQINVVNIGVNVAPINIGPVVYMQAPRKPSKR